MRTLDARGVSTGKVLDTLNRDPANMERALIAAREIVERVRREGDDALFSYSEKFDGVRPAKLVLDRKD